MGQAVGQQVPLLWGLVLEEGGGDGGSCCGKEDEATTRQ